MRNDAMQDLLGELEARDARADEGGGPARIARHRRLGRLTARERIAELVDAGSFVELGRHVVHRHADASEQLAANVHPGDGLVAGLAKVGGRSIVVYAHDPTVMRGALGAAAARKLCRLLDMAAEGGLPVVSFADSDGARVDEGIDAIEGYGEVMRRTVRLRGRAPQITLVCGLCVGAAAYNAALTDFVGMIAGQSFMFITGPKVAKVATGEDVTIEDLGGPEMHATKTGTCHAVLPDERAGIAWLKRVLALLAPVVPSEDPPTRELPELEGLVPLAPRRAYDMRKVITAIFDEGSALELSQKFAPNLLTFVARLGGRTVAIVANQPTVLAGCLDVNASRKGAAFVAWANRTRWPIVTLVDVPGYLPGKRQEQEGILSHGSTLLTSYLEATVPIVSLVVRKSFGGANVLSFSADVRLALPSARISPMGADATLEVLLGPLSPDATPDEQVERERRRDEWRKRNDHAWAPAEAGYVDRVIAPSEARSVIASTIDQLCAVRGLAR